MPFQNPIVQEILRLLHPTQYISLKTRKMTLGKKSAIACHTSRILNLIHFLASENDEHIVKMSRTDTTQYVSLDVMSSFLPTADPRTIASSKTRPWYCRQGSVFVLGSAVALAVLHLNLNTLLVCHIRFPSSTIYIGDCEKASALTSILHAVINLLSTLLLAKSLNACPYWPLRQGQR